MPGWLLDTNVLSELRRPRPNSKVVRFIEQQPLSDQHISEVSLAEIRFGIERTADQLKRADLTSWLDHRVRPMFAQRILPITEDVMLRWRILVENGRTQGHTFPQPDLIIAATALLHDLTIVTRNVSDFQQTQCRVVDPWL